MRSTEQYRLIIKPGKGTVNNAKGKIERVWNRIFKKFSNLKRKIIKSYCDIQKHLL